MSIHKIAMSKTDTAQMNSYQKILISEIISPNKLEESWTDQKHLLF